MKPKRYFLDGALVDEEWAGLCKYFFTKKTDFEITRAWAHIIQRECGLSNVPLALQ